MSDVPTNVEGLEDEAPFASTKQRLGLQLAGLNTPYRLAEWELRIGEFSDDEGVMPSESTE